MRNTNNNKTVTICCNLYWSNPLFCNLNVSNIESHSLFQSFLLILQGFKIFLKLCKLQLKSHPVICTGCISSTPFLYHTFIIVSYFPFLSSKNIVLPNLGKWGSNAPSVFKMDAMLASWPLKTLYFSVVEGLSRSFSKCCISASNQRPVARTKILKYVWQIKRC